MDSLLTRPSRKTTITLKIEQIVNINQLFNVIVSKPKTSGYSGELRNLAIGIYEELKVEY
ncbi:hypothetical protein CYQ91_20660 [Vibrio diabolicus]|uniref:Uncharacterized protein n=1 Tax=Vibrio diabolicus TaxID=50719 RepID=A0AAX1XHS9_9VIBR|nr:hypothetical protein CYQ91_20660 [Vibrio diabolicus]